MQKVGYIIVSYAVAEDYVGKPLEDGWVFKGLSMVRTDDKVSLEKTRTWAVMGKDRDALVACGNLFPKGLRIIY